MLFKGQILSTSEPTTVISTTLDGNTADLQKQLKHGRFCAVDIINPCYNQAAKPFHSPAKPRNWCPRTLSPQKSFSIS